MTAKEAQLAVLLEIIAPSNDYEPQDGPTNGLPEDVRNSIKTLWESGCSWEDVFSPIEDIITRTKYIDLFNELEKQKMEGVE